MSNKRGILAGVLRLGIVWIFVQFSWGKLWDPVRAFLAPWGMELAHFLAVGVYRSEGFRPLSRAGYQLWLSWSCGRCRIYQLGEYCL